MHHTRPEPQWPMLRLPLPGQLARDGGLPGHAPGSSRHLCPTFCSAPGLQWGCARLQEHPSSCNPPLLYLASPAGQRAQCPRQGEGLSPYGLSGTAGNGGLGRSRSLSHGYFPPAAGLCTIFWPHARIQRQATPVLGTSIGSLVASRPDHGASHLNPPTLHFSGCPVSTGKYPSSAKVPSVPLGLPQRGEKKRR